MISRTAVLVSHTTGLEGPINYYAAFLQSQGRDVTLISHPLDDYVGADSSVTVNGSPVWTRRRTRGGVVALIVDLVITLGWLVRTPSKLYVGANNIDTVCCLLGRFVTRRRDATVVFFASDYAETRFASSVLDRLYRAAERAALTRSDVVVSNTHRAAAKRAELGLQADRSVVVPNGVDNPGEPPLKTPLPGHFVYIGSVTREHGLFEMLTALRPMVKRFLLIGDGDDWERVVALAETLDADVETHRAKNREFVLQHLRDFAGFGLAPYNNASRWTLYCSPLKIVEYVASGIPVIVSDVPEIAAVISERGLGITYHDLSAHQLIRQLETYDSDGFASRAASFSADYDSNVLYRRIPT